MLKNTDLIILDLKYYAELSWIKQSRFPVAFVKFSYSYLVSSSLVQDFRAIILHNTTLLTVVVKLSSMPRYFKEELFHLVLVKAENGWPWLLFWGCCKWC